MPLGLASASGAIALATSLLQGLSPDESRAPGGDQGCLQCHAGIEAMHPQANLSCVDCHGGNPAGTTVSAAHVATPAARGEDERVLPLDRDLAWIRFRNPMDLRVVDRTCGTCHSSAVASLRASLHGTTAGHLSDGYYEVGLLEQPGSRYSVFQQSSAPLPGGDVEQLVQVPPFQDRLPRDQLATHYTDLARKECMQCHLYSQGRAVRGRIGFDGDYRGAGCAACHVEYALEGLSQSADPCANRTEPGHPRVHAMTRTPGTQTCTSCHYGDASIGLHFRGLSQLPPNAPGGPEVQGTTDQLLNRVFYLDDPSIVPPDVHHESGMHCIDCHTLGDVMGDGRLHGHMEDAVEISCSACHGTFDAPSALVTERGTPLEHLRREGERVILRSKVDGREHPVPQVVHVLDPERPEFNAKAVRAMTPDHAGIECYACHAGWNVNFLGFHFSRREQLTQLDLLSGKRTPGRVTTQEKVFASWKSFYAGRNERGAIAPYMTGFSTMGSVWDGEGRLILDQVMPVTARDLSGLTMIHHQPHSTRPTARSCVECHRTSATWGMGSANFRLARQLAFVADRRGVEVVAIDRRDFTRSASLAKIPLPDVVDMAVRVDPLQGHAQHLFVAEGGRGIHVLDVSSPTEPRRVAFLATIEPRGLEVVGDELYVADGTAGLRILDVSRPGSPRLLGHVPTFDAHDVEVRWPYAYVADGPAGICLVDVTVPIAPRVLGECDLNGEARVPNEAILVESLFQYSRPLARAGVPVDERTRARNVCAVLDLRRGLYLVDVTEPTRPQILHPSLEERSRPLGPGAQTFRGLALSSQVDLADAQGGEPTLERDYVYLLSERGRGDQRRSGISLLDVTDPTRVLSRGPDRTRVAAGYTTEQLVLADYYDPPTRRRIAFSPGSRGVYVADLTISKEPSQVGALPGLLDAYAVCVEEFPLDRMIREDGQPEKDVSHPGSRWLWRSEIERVLAVGMEQLGTEELYPDPGETPGEALRARFAAADEDRSGWLEGPELEPAGAAGADQDGDGRVGLLELATTTRALGLLGEAAPEEDERELTRVRAQGELAGLLGAVSPYPFDADRSGSLSRAEASRAFFAALDLDQDGGLSLDELSRQAGEWRSLRFGDARARKAFERVDRNRDGRVTAREFELGEPEWLALDLDGDGNLRLVAPLHEFQRQRGLVLPGSEWPSTRTDLQLLPPGIRAEALLQEFDRDGDGALAARELAGRADLLAVFDANGDQKVERVELERRLARLDEDGVHALADDFLGRWDLDGSGAVEADELPEGTHLRLGPR